MYNTGLTGNTTTYGSSLSSDRAQTDRLLAPRVNLPLEPTSKDDTVTPVPELCLSYCPSFEAHSRYAPCVTACLNVLPDNSEALITFIKCGTNILSLETSLLILLLY